MPVSVLVRPVEPERDDLVEVTQTIDFSRNGVCFVTLSDHYQVGSALFVTLPFYPAGQGSKKWRGEVVRIERLSNGAQAIAVRFLNE